MTLDNFRMSNGNFAVVGTRPPSVLSRPSSALSGHHGYHTLAKHSTVDESLFGTQHPTRLDSSLGKFKAPWDYPKPSPPSRTFGTSKTKVIAKREKSGPPLLWCPTPGASSHPIEKTKVKSNLKDSHLLWNTRDHFRQLQHKPSFVDETLFGSGLQEPSFKAPWNERKKGEKKMPRPYLYDPSCSKADFVHNEREFDSISQIKRPSTALGISRNGNKVKTVPVWKP